MNETDRSESVRMVRDSVRAIVPAGGDLNRIRALRWDSRGVDGAVWQQVVDLAPDSPEGQAAKKGLEGIKSASGAK